MNKSFKIFAVSMLLILPVSIFAQGKIADSSKNVETNETLQITPCPAPAESVSPIKGVGVVIKKGSSSSERTLPGEQNSPVNPNVTSSDALKTRTKSNNANERTQQNKCIEPDIIDAKKPVIFKFKPGGNAVYNIRIYQLKEDQNYSNGVTAEKIIFEKTLSNVGEFTLDKLITSVQPPYRTNYVWQVQEIDNQGKGIGEKQYGWIQASFDK